MVRGTTRRAGVLGQPLGLPLALPLLEFTPDTFGGDARAAWLLATPGAPLPCVGCWVLHAVLSGPTRLDVITG